MAREGNIFQEFKIEADLAGDRTSVTMSSILKHLPVPVIAGSLLLILTRGPSALQAAIFRVFNTPQSQQGLIISLKCVLALGLTNQANALLTTWARNNWQLKTGQVPWKWTEEVAVVTGGSNGMGALVVKGLAAKGLKVAVLDIQPLPEDLQSLPHVAFFRCDITSVEQVKQTAKAVKVSLGAPSILCNNAGIAHAHTLLEASTEWIRKVFDVNLISHFHLIQAFLPDMIKQKKGHIVTTASMASFVGCAGLVDYCATKAGVLSLHEGLTQELKHRYNAPYIKTSIVHPIYVRTQLIKSYENSLRQSRAVVIEPETVANAIVKQIVSGRSGQVIVPSWMSVASGVRGWPAWLQELIRDSTARDVVEENQQ